MIAEEIKKELMGGSEERQFVKMKASWNRYIKFMRDVGIRKSKEDPPGVFVHKNAGDLLVYRELHKHVESFSREMSWRFADFSETWGEDRWSVFIDFMKLNRKMKYSSMCNPTGVYAYRLRRIKEFKDLVGVSW